jgi:enoyl-CoA hydratase/carnithine racemase
MSEILVDRSRSGIGIVTIDRPARRNALNAAAWRGIGEAFTAFTRDGDVRLGILTGAAGHFSAGDDVKDFAAIRHDAAAEAAYTAQIRATYDAMLEAPFPVVAAIEGVCVGGACSLALCCDFRVARRGARFGIPPAKLGLIYPADHIQRLVALVGPAATRRWLYSGELFDADEAAATGFLDRLVDGEAVEAAVEFGAPMLDNAPLSIAGAKLAINAAVTGELALRAEALAALTRRAEESDDRREGERAFAEKRKPRFIGR